ncbi:hypothetical protein ALQ03_03007 [Pseudomonas savastanoi pv. glycinea]|uniref:Uncharacterized protein n=2 Tax=Pseudomonas savastanoi TaxID=29438 RepID=A0A0P9RXV4_PSESG|nr:Uncharacterized protein ALO37_02423 [Pseudomonas savastanoi pv. glycinea]RMO36076.1 hypothetical protein ALQ42_02082 [Pseudomonas savastanoi pv. glycinea]RMQ15560.1 hypothetical protein ALQ10_03144 [Pseudomonas savastanoi pv. glycinea]RMQ20167.1 hypothetical protein ALQ11_02733 [Pseudomonas savastanoi pv. glycinea]RMQ52740.1 hypothetical protein ALQ03_03007 [Pseudomonas savastanoi pv. glycinea]
MSNVMGEQVDFSNVWETGLVKIARSQLRTLRELDEDFTGNVGAFDVDAALNRLCALTDLVYEADFEFSQQARAALLRINEDGMEVIRRRAMRELAPSGRPGGLDVEPVVALYHAILSNLPSFAAGETSGHALALSRTMYSELVQRCANYPRFDAVSSVVCVHAYEAMQLARLPKNRL